MRTQSPAGRRAVVLNVAGHPDDYHMTRVLAARLAGRHITVNTVAPGPFESQMTAWLLDNYRDEITQSCSLRRIGAPDDMAGIAIFLASRAGAYVNGAVIPVDGGISVQ